MKQVVTFGEIMLRLSPPLHQRLAQAGSLDVTYGGGEANVAAALAHLGMAAAHVGVALVVGQRITVSTQGAEEQPLFGGAPLAFPPICLG